MSSSAKTSIRVGQRADIVPLIEMLGREFVPVAPDAANFDPARAACILDQLPRLYLGLLEGEIVGCLGLRHSVLWWTGTPYVCDQPFFVAERARTSTLARDLLAAGERYAAEQGLPLIVTVSSGTDVDRKDLWFRRKGFRVLGGLYAKGV